MSATTITITAQSGSAPRSDATSTRRSNAPASAVRAEPSVLTVEPPPLPRRGERRDGLPPIVRRAMVAFILSLHLLAVWAVLQIREVREAVAAAAPVFVSLLAAPEVPKPVEVPPPPVARPQVTPTPPAAVLAVAPSTTPSNFEVPAPSPVPVPVPVPVITEPSPPATAPVVPAAPAAAITVPPAPKVIPTSDIQYLEPIELDYPRLSKRNGESGTTTVRVYIDETGRAKNAQVYRSSGHTRLDEAALAAVQRARFKPYVQNGVPTAGYAYIPLEFELEK